MKQGAMLRGDVAQKSWLGAALKKLPLWISYRTTDAGRKID
jgi:hypothetical protein